MGFQPGRPVFKDRQDAGRRLADRLSALNIEKPIVIALPRGGVPVAFEVARKLGAPLDVLMVRKLGAPDQPEYGIGAITETGYTWINEQAAADAGVSADALAVIQREKAGEVDELIRHFRRGRPLSEVRGRTVILVDDGLATGATAIVSCQYLRTQGAKAIILAVPVGAPDSLRRLAFEANQVICLERPRGFMAVSHWYEHFEQIPDREVTDLLFQSRELHGRPREINEEIRISVSPDQTLEGQLVVPASPTGLVLFAHGSGSGRRSPRNLRVARALNEAGMGTLLFDLLTPEESLDRRLVFDIPLLADRLKLATRYVREFERLRHLPLGYFGASTGAGAALHAAADCGPEEIAAVVSRGGRPDLAMPRLPEVRTPTLLLVGGDDLPVIEMNREALAHLVFGKLVIIQGATHLFEEPGTLEAVASHATTWFAKYFKRTFGARKTTAA